ncbi:MAG: hypothetical protein WC043_02495 [Pseudobdellovibrionaceae bacterium]
MEHKGLYKSFKIGYLGDYAGLSCELVTPVVGKSSRPKDKYRREDFTVITTSEQFNRTSLADRIAGLEKSGADPVTHAFLQVAQEELDAFIAANGETNPYETLDWNVCPA